MRTERMAAIFVPQSPTSPGLKTTKSGDGHLSATRSIVGVEEEIEGLIRVYKDGHVERAEVVPCVSPALPPELAVISRDTIIDKPNNVWARLYSPISPEAQQAVRVRGNIDNNKEKMKKKALLAVVVYFHGGGFCVGSAAWSCYHEFLGKLSAESGCLIMSVNYRLAPENPLPSAYEDGAKALLWLEKQKAKALSSGTRGYDEWWIRRCDLGRVYVAGDSAGGNIAYNVAARAKPLGLGVKGVVLLQPFFGGEERTGSERSSAGGTRSSPLSVAASDTYWRLALPEGADRDHPWCNPLGKTASLVGGLRMLVCVAEMDVLRDRNLEFCREMGRLYGGNAVEYEVYGGVGHAFQVLSKSPISQTRSCEMLRRINDFVSRC